MGQLIAKELAGYTKHGTPIHFLDQIRYRYSHAEWRFSRDQCAFFYFTHVVLANIDFDRRFLSHLLFHFFFLPSSYLYIYI